MENEQIIFHILPADEWQKAKENGVYKPNSLEAEGFIHCSTRAQVIQTANNYFKGQSNLMLLWIDAEKVHFTIRYEDLMGEGKLFPHLYGQLNLDAVVRASTFNSGEDGGFIFPTSDDTWD